MTTLSSARAAADFPVFRPGGGQLGVAWGSIEVATIQVATDIMEFCKLPADAIIVGGHLIADDIDTGTEVYELDLGVAGDTAALVNSGVLDGDLQVSPNLNSGFAGVPNSRLFDGLLDAGVVDLGGRIGDEVTVIGTVVVAANATGLGTVSVCVYYTVP